MPANVIKTSRDEHLWNLAKDRAATQGRAKDYAYIMGIFQRMQGEKSMVNLLAGGGDELLKAKQGDLFSGPPKVHSKQSGFGFGESKGGGKAKPKQMGFDFSAKKDKSASGSKAMGGPYIGPKGGKWADPQHTIPWSDTANVGSKKESDSDLKLPNIKFKVPDNGPPQIRGKVFSDGKIVTMRQGKKVVEAVKFDTDVGKPLYVKLEGKPDLISQVKHYKEMKAKIEAHKKNTILKNIPGLKEVRALGNIVSNDEARYAFQFKRMMGDESNDGASPPRGTNKDNIEKLKKLFTKYPKAALYFAAKRQSDSAHWADSTGKGASAKNAMKILEQGGSYEEAKEALSKRTVDFDKAMNWLDEFDKLEKAASGKVIGRTSDGKEVYAHNGNKDEYPDKLQKKKAKPDDKEKADDEESDEGSFDHHRDRALSHLQAAQAHAAAAKSAKTVEQAKDHKQVVGEAKQASDAAVKTGKKSMEKSIMKNNLNINLTSEDEIIQGLEDGTFAIGGQSASLNEDGRSRLLGMRGERLVKSPIYQGEVDGQRGSDYRETVVRAQALSDHVYIDEAGNRGQGGLADWFKDAWTGQPNVNVPVGAAHKGWMKSDKPVVIVDDSDTMQRNLQRSSDQAGVMMAYKGEGRGGYRRG